MQYSNETNQLLISMYHGSAVTELHFKRDVRRNLIHENLIHTSTSYEDPNVYLTEAGKAYVESLLASKADKKTEKFRFWLPLIVSNLISITALIVAILAYIKQ